MAKLHPRKQRQCSCVGLSENTGRGQSFINRLLGVSGDERVSIPIDLPPVQVELTPDTKKDLFLTAGIIAVAIMAGRAISR